MKPETTITEVGGVIQITGYAYTFRDDHVQGGPANGGWIERIERKALKLPRKMVLHHNIEQYRQLASTRGGTLQLSLDDIGLKVVATPSDDLWAKPWCRSMIRTPIDIVMEFKVKNQQWSAAPGFGVATYRLITKLELRDLFIEPRKAQHVQTITATTETAGSQEGS